MMNTHDYCVNTIGKIIMELERCARASISAIEMLEKDGRYTPEQAREITAHIRALCMTQDNHISPILEREIQNAKSELGGDENAL